MTKTTLSIVALTLFLTATAGAATLSSFYVIPFVNHIPRSTEGTEMSDVAFSNPNATDVRVSLALISYGLHNTTNNIFAVNDLTVPANGSVLVKDVLKDYKGEFANLGASLGALLVASADGKSFGVTSTSYLQRPDGSTIGYTVPATADFLTGSTQPSTGEVIAYIPGIRNTDRYRTQIGFVIGNAEGLPALLEFTLRDAAGVILGTRQYYLDPGAFAELEFPSTLIADRTFDIASLQVRIVGGGAVTSYAKVIDKTTQDASYIMAEAPAGSAPRINVQSPFHSLMDRVRAIE